MRYVPRRLWLPDHRISGLRAMLRWPRADLGDIDADAVTRLADEAGYLRSLVGQQLSAD